MSGVTGYRILTTLSSSQVRGPQNLRFDPGFRLDWLSQRVIFKFPKNREPKVAIIGTVFLLNIEQIVRASEARSKRGSISQQGKILRTMCFDLFFTRLQGARPAAGREIFIIVCCLTKSGKFQQFLASHVELQFLPILAKPLLDSEYLPPSAASGPMCNTPQFGPDQSYTSIHYITTDNSPFFHSQNPKYRTKTGSAPACLVKHKFS
jgi:hypothetical protein